MVSWLGSWALLLIGVGGARVLSRNRKDKLQPDDGLLPMRNPFNPVGSPTPAPFGTVPITKAPPATTTTTTTRDWSKLYDGQILEAGEALFSSNGKVRLNMQGDGNLKLYDAPPDSPHWEWRELWESGTWGWVGAFLGWGSDGPGRLRIFGPSGATDSGNVLWAPGAGAGIQWAHVLSLEDDCKIVLYNTAGQVLWSSGTQCLAKRIVTLGDSYSSGTGLHSRGHEYDEEYGGWISILNLHLTQRSDNECWRDLHDTPGPKYARANDMQSIFLACKGAMTHEMYDQIEYLNHLYPAYAAAQWEDSVIHFTIGGNDVRTRRAEDWPELVERCIFNPNCDHSIDNQIFNWDIVYSRLMSLFMHLASLASRAKIRVMGYPRMFQRDGTCWGVTGIGGGEADWFDSEVDELNARIQNAVILTRYSNPGLDIEYVSVVNYITKGACETSGREVNDRVVPSFTDFVSDASFHPTHRGYDRYLEALTASLR